MPGDFLSPPSDAAATKKRSKRKPSLGSFESKKRQRMSIGEMIRTDRDASDYYLLEALRSDVRKCEADYDTVVVMEECRRIKVLAVLAKAQVKEVEEERDRERDEAVR